MREIQVVSQAESRRLAGWAGAISRCAQFAPQILVEMLHAVFEWCLIRPNLIEALRHQRKAAGIHAQRDFVVFHGSFEIRRLFRFDKFAFE